jgi:hypothetical protein
LNNKNNEPFLPYEGKGIRHIIIVGPGYGRKTDTANETHYFGKEFVGQLHRNTREWVTRNNLFIREKTALNANLVADNERYLRSLEYMHDPRILVNTIADEPDSVDLVVITKDFLSINFQIIDVDDNGFRSRIGDANILGTGQKIQFTALLGQNRAPHFGYEILYRNNSIGNTFINTSLFYSKINPNLNDGMPDEQTWRAQIERPLVSQYMHVAGAITLAGGETYNLYSRPDSLFYHYQYKTFDAWIGYNFRTKKSLSFRSGLTRQFLSIRYLRKEFTEAPYQMGKDFNFRLNSREALLAQFTLFRQNFYRTNYIFGFGVTEDVPYGYNIAFTAGWYKQQWLERAYAGIDANLYSVTNRGNVIQYFLRAGGFVDKGDIQDAHTLIGVSTFSRVITLKSMKLRQYFRLSYTRQFNLIGLDPLRINNVFGLQYMHLDSARGNERLNLHTETMFFLKYKIHGFRLAPFLSVDIAQLTPVQEKSPTSGVYSGFGGGLRARNENLLFNTIEIRFMYFPRRSSEHNTYRLTLASDLHFRITNSYVKAPNIIQVNNDNDNTIY